MKLGELRKMTAHLDDETEIISVDSNYEIRGNLTEARVSVGYFKKEVGNFRDDFDKTPYKKTIFTHSNEEEGEERIVIR